MSGMFLDRAELERYTGRKRKKAQMKVLRDRRVPFDVDIDGWPVVLKASIEKKILGKATTEEPGVGPNFNVFPALG